MPASFPLQLAELHQKSAAPALTFFVGWGLSPNCKLHARTSADNQYIDIGYFREYPSVFAVLQHPLNKLLMKYIAYIYCIKAIILFSVIIISFANFRCNADDSIPAKELSEVVVEGKRSWIEGEKVVFIPTKKERNHANSMESLLQNMNMPVLKASQEGALVDINGNAISYYINGIPVSEIDAKTFWPKDAKSVEYYANPSDPKYGGKKAVINFVMTKYKAGGVGVVKGDQSTTPSGTYQAATKVKYKRMNYGAWFYGNYHRYKTYNDQDIEYRNLYYDNIFYDKILNHALDTAEVKTDFISAGIEANYNKNQTYVNNSLTLSWQHEPWQTSKSVNTWAPDIFASSAAGTGKRSSSISPTYKGICGFSINPKFFLETMWQYAFVSTNRTTDNWTGTLTPIYNSAAEKSHIGSIAITPVYSIPQFGNLYLNLRSELQNIVIDYDGSYDNKTTQLTGRTTIAPRIEFYKIKNTYLFATAGAKFLYWKAGDNAWTHSCSPNAAIGGQWRNEKLSIYGQYKYITKLPSADVLSDAIVRESELVWRSGNPGLKNPSTHTIDLNAFWMANKWLSLNFGADYYRYEHNAIIDYESAPKDMGGLIYTYKDSKPYGSCTLSAGIYLSFLSNDLTFRITPYYTYEYSHEKDGQNLHSFLLYGSATYRLKNFSFNVNYKSPQSNLAQGGLYKLHRSGYLDLKISYGNGDFLVSVKADNILHKNTIHKMERRFGNYYSFETFKQPGRSFAIELSYFFKYGKRIKENVNINTQTIGRSGIVGSNTDI